VLSDLRLGAEGSIEREMEKRNERLTVIVAGGGTGGHLFPGLAVVDAMARRRAVELVFVGSERGIESRVVPKLGHRLHLLPVRALRGQNAAGTLAAAFQVPVSVATAWRILGEVRPDLVLGVGGYASAPAALAAWARRIPTVLIEQNAMPGMTNRLLGRIADRVCVNFPETARYFPRDRTVETGNPVRMAEPAPRTSGEFSVLVFGGSAGARRLNEVGVEAFARLAAEGKVPRIVHQTGHAEADAVTARYRDRGVVADVRPFIDDMPTAYAAADLVVCRAGASTLAELTALGKPAILVPYPFAADDHQRRNAEALVARGAAVMILDREITAEKLAAAIASLRDDPAKLRAMAEAAKLLGRPDAAEKVVDVCLALIDERMSRN
jgi:UDP-N-acetylglucosamine--N-acetylmuramyl-(pentapeptide) pyrophosphoryl-undecaprenol N-acetylglucosamine transferase